MPLLKEDVYGYLESVEGERVELSREDYDAVRAALRVVRGGKATAGKPDPWLTTGQAADELGVSRRTLTRILDRGDIPFERYGNGHRRVRMREVLRYKAEEDERRNKAREELHELLNTSLDDLDYIEEYLKQFE